MKKLSIVIPVFNEEHTISQVLQKVIDLPLPGYNKEVIVINDGSSDMTSQKLHPHKQAITYIEHSHNQGKGQAFKTALSVVTGDYVIIQDADLEYDPADFPSLLNALQQRDLHVVYGSRNIHPQRKGYRHYVWGGKVLTSIINVLYGAHLTDAYTCYKLYRTSLLKDISFEGKGFEFESELTCRILKKGTEIGEVPIHYYPRSFREGKKINTRDGLKALKAILHVYFKG